MASVAGLPIAQIAQANTPSQHQIPILPASTDERIVPGMELNEQPKAVIHLFSSIDRQGHYNRKDLPSGRVQLLFNGAQIGGWADDYNGPHWYVLENKRTLALNPSYRVILEHFGFERIRQNEQRHYWRVRGAEGMWLFKRAVEEITGVRL